jgi:zinc transporter, ZIP family
VSSDLLAVLAAGSLAVLASACGPLPLALRRRVDKASLGSGTAIAAGVMLAVGGGLLLGSPDDAGLIVAGVAAGIVFVQVLRAALARRGDVDITDLAGRPDRHRAVLIVAVLTTHSAAEGIGLASAFAGSRAFGWTIGLALAVHKLPEGLAVGLALTPRGVSVRVAAGFAALAALPLPLLAAPAFVFLDAFREILPAALGFAAGAMIFVVASEMLPEARRQVGGRAALIYCGTTFAATALFELAVSLA